MAAIHHWNYTRIIWKYVLFLMYYLVFWCYLLTTWAILCCVTNQCHTTEDQPVHSQPQQSVWTSQLQESTRKASPETAQNSCEFQQSQVWTQTQRPLDRNCPKFKALDCTILHKNFLWQTPTLLWHSSLSQILHKPAPKGRLKSALNTAVQRGLTYTMVHYAVCSDTPVFSRSEAWSISSSWLHVTSGSTTVSTYYTI